MSALPRCDEGDDRCPTCGQPKPRRIGVAQLMASPFISVTTNRSIFPDLFVTGPE